MSGVEDKATANKATTEMNPSSDSEELSSLPITNNSSEDDTIAKQAQPVQEQANQEAQMTDLVRLREFLYGQQTRATEAQLREMERKVAHVQEVEGKVAHLQQEVVALTRIIGLLNDKLSETSESFSSQLNSLRDDMISWLDNYIGDQDTQLQTLQDTINRRIDQQEQAQFARIRELEQSLLAQFDNQYQISEHASDQGSDHPLSQAQVDDEPKASDAEFDSQAPPPSVQSELDIQNDLDNSDDHIGQIVAEPHDLNLDDNNQNSEHS